MSLKKRWKYKSPPPARVVDALQQSLSVDKNICTLLAQRGITDFNESKTFFRPSLEQLHDPFLMKDMDLAVERLEEALRNREGVMIYGDYDVDGTTAVALVYSFFKNYAAKIDYYIPDRYKEGYGISFTGIDYAKEHGYSLIVALDCGIKSNDKIDYAKSLGIDFIICDHHRPGEVLPKAAAVLDPKREDCQYPFDELSGCGIGFKLVEAFARNNNLFPDNSISRQLVSYLDFVAVSIAADIVPITGENRVMAFYGLQQLNTRKREGFKAIIELSGLRRELTIGDIVFTIAPRINAAGRIDSGKKAVDLLVSNNVDVAADSGKDIDETNTERKNIDTVITQQAFAMIEESALLQQSKSTVLYHSEWHKGVVGIVASRLTEKYYRPTVVLTESNGMATGSARSVKNFDVYNAIEACADLLEQFGGHKYAAGLTLKIENVKAFQEKFEEIVSSTISEDMLIPEIEVDIELPLINADYRFYKILKQFAPFGPGNMNPVFIAKGVKHHGNIRQVGSNHIKLDLVQEGMTKQIPAIAFGLGHMYDRLLQCSAFDICYSLEENEWNGNSFLQLNIKDIHIYED
jgi:single-stranded-DNA-specific exonuclease